MTGAPAAAWLLQTEPVLNPWTWTLTRTEQYLISIGLFALFAVVAGVVYPLKRRVGDDEAVEAIQSLLLTLMGLAITFGIVVVWRLRAELSEAFTFIRVGPTDGVRVLVLAAVFGTAFTVTRITKRVIRRGSEADAITAHQKEVAHHIVQFLVFAPAGLFSLALYGVNPQSLLLGASAAGLIVGLAARQTLGAIVTGFVLLLSRPFEVNEWVIVDEQEGIVTDISMFNTEIRTFDNEVVVIPNDGFDLKSGFRGGDAVFDTGPRNGMHSFENACLFVDDDGAKIDDADLYDIAPTVLELLDIGIDRGEFDGASLV